MTEQRCQNREPESCAVGCVSWSGLGERKRKDTRDQLMRPRGGEKRTPDRSKQQTEEELKKKKNVNPV